MNIGKLYKKKFCIFFSGKVVFEKISLFCGHYAELIPVTFVLGFYVSLLVTRWWKQFETMPWPDSAAVWISTCIKGKISKSDFTNFFNFFCGNFLMKNLFSEK